MGESGGGGIANASTNNMTIAFRWGIDPCRPSSPLITIAFKLVVLVFHKAQGASIRTERKPFEPERFSELGRTRIGLERSGCTEIFTESKSVIIKKSKYLASFTAAKRFLFWILVSLNSFNSPSQWKYDCM